jgi:hypothetical protein
MEAHLAIPFSIPLLGDSFTNVKNPMIFSSIDLSYRITVVSTPLAGSELTLPIFHPQLRIMISRILKKKGLSGSFSLSPMPSERNENDFIATASLLYLGGVDDTEQGLPALLDRADDKALIILSRALTSLSGGFVVCRRGEGLISLDGGLEAAVHLKVKGQGRGTSARLDLFSSKFPDLAQPLWHLLGHLVLEGGMAIANHDNKTMGRLLTMESSLAHSVGLVDLGELRRIECLEGSYGGKVICSSAMRGELILAPDEIPTLPSFQRFHFTQEGVHELEKC